MRLMKMIKEQKTGVLLINLGTPSAPTAYAVKQFLRDFLSDKRVVDLPDYLWQPLLRGIILPFRAPKVARLYHSIWQEEGSPLLVYAQRQQQKLSQRLSLPVALGMTYGNPSLAKAFDELCAQDVTDIVVLPLFPQYSATTTGAAFDALAKVIGTRAYFPHLHFISDYHQHPLYIHALAQQVRTCWQQHGEPERLICSYHGIPERYAAQGDLYAQHCQQTTQLLAQALGMPKDRILTSYQSRFGKEEWLKPYTDQLIQSLPKQGIEHIAVICPAFSADCLETLEEIDQQNRQFFFTAGGKQFDYIACLNDSDEHITLLAELVAPFITN